MATDFPASPVNGQQFTSGGMTWTWDGTKWTAAGLVPPAQQWSAGLVSSVAGGLSIAGGVLSDRWRAAQVNTVGTGLVLSSNTLSVNQVGVTDGSSAAAGNIGEYVTAANTGGTPMTTATTLNVTQLTLTAGDWSVSGSVVFSPATAGMTQMSAGIGLVSATLPTTAQVTNGQGIKQQLFATFALSVQVLGVGPLRINNAATVYLTAQSTFTGTNSASGYLTARRVR